MKNKLKDKIAVITGATSGIGRSIAEHLRAQGVKIVNISKDATNTEFFKSYQCDISDDAALTEVIDEVKNFCQPDFLFCNAGFGTGGTVVNTAVEDIDKLFNVNLIAHVKMVKLLAPSVKDGGKIFFTGSLASIIPLPYQACYSASKAAIENFSRALATELKSRKIQVCTIMPGDIHTNFTAARIYPEHCDEREAHSIAKTKKAELGGDSPDIVGKLAMKLVRKKRIPLRVSVGFGNKLLAVFAKFLPVRLVNFLVEKIYV